MLFMAMRVGVSASDMEIATKIYYVDSMDDIHNCLIRTKLEGIYSLRVHIHIPSSFRFLVIRGFVIVGIVSRSYVESITHTISVSRVWLFIYETLGIANFANGKVNL